MRPSARRQATPADVDLVGFINEFLFSHHENPAAPSSLRRQRTPPRPKRYRSMWKAAATSLIAKRSASQETKSRADDRPLNSCSAVSVPDGNFLSANARELLACVSRDHDGDLATNHSQEHTKNSDITINIDAAPPVTITRDCDNEELREIACTHVIPKRSSRKPPRPPKVGVLRSGSYRAIRLKTASRRAIVDSVRVKKKKTHSSTSNTTFIWALIVTICFVSIMLVQGFFGSNSQAFPATVDGQELVDGAFLPPSQMGPLL